MNVSNLQYVFDEQGNKIAVIVPIEIWQDLIGEDETNYLLKSETMKNRLLSAKNRQTGISFEEAGEKLRI